MKEALGLMPLITVDAPMNDFKLASLGDFNAASGCDPACYKMSVGPEGWGTDSSCEISLLLCNGLDPIKETCLSSLSVLCLYLSYPILLLRTYSINICGRWIHYFSAFDKFSEISRHDYKGLKSAEYQNRSFLCQIRTALNTNAYCDKVLIYKFTGYTN